MMSEKLLEITMRMRAALEAIDIDQKIISAIERDIIQAYEEGKKENYITYPYASGTETNPL